MAQSFQPVVVNSTNHASFITFVLQKHALPTTIVICSSREAFLADLQAACHRTGPRVTSPQLQDMQVTKHQILIPTIYLLAAARDICLVFTPTLPHLRAYLATYTPHNGSRNGTTIYQKPGVQVPMLALLNPLSIHRTTSEHSAQGLSRTFALAVEAAARGCMQLTVSESSTPQEEVLMDAGDGYGDTLQIDPWKEQVSLLNGSIKFRGEDRVWAGRTLEVGRVVERWCRRIQIFDEQNGG